MHKSILIFVICALLCVLLALYSAPALAVAREGFILWRDNVFPALLPFFVCAHIMQNCGAIHGRSRIALYGLSMVSGAPAGARLAGSQQGDATDMVASLNAVSPMFICGSFAAGMLGQPALAWPILIAQLLSSALFLLLSNDTVEYILPMQIAERPSFLQLLSEAIASGVTSLFSVGGTIMVFMALHALFDKTGILALITAPFSILLVKLGQPAELPYIIFSGLMEMVHGCKELVAAGLSLRLTATIGAFFFSFGGICIMAQSLTFTKLRIRRYLWKKLLQGCLSGFLTYLLVPLFLPDAQAVFSSLPPETIVQNAFSAALIAGISLAAASAVLLLSAIAGKRSAP